MASPRFNDLTNPFQRARSMTGLSQHKLAKELDLKQSIVSRYESSQLFPGPEVAKRFVAWCKKRRIRMSLEEVYQRLGG